MAFNAQNGDALFNLHVFCGTVMNNARYHYLEDVYIVHIGSCGRHHSADTGHIAHNSNYFMFDPPPEAPL